MPRQLPNQADGFTSLFNNFRDSILSIDPVHFCEKNLTLDGNPFRLTGNGYKPFAEIYRYIAISSLSEESMPVVLVKGRQVGATTMAAALECYFMACGLFGTHGRPPMRIMHIFPTLSLAAAYTKDKFDNVIGQSRPVEGLFKSNGLPKSFIESQIDNSSPANNSMHFKRFRNGNQVWIESAGIDGDRIRGRTIDCMFGDEVQDITKLALGTITKTLTQGKYGRSGFGVQIYFGTPKQKGGVYWDMWQKSTQQYYHLGCEKCGELFPLYRPDIKWEDIWIYGKVVRCNKCGHEQDKNEAVERGKWIPLVDPNDFDDPKKRPQLIGYHINQLYLPHVSREAIDAQKPGIHPTNSEKTYMNEVLGEFYDGEGGTITLEEIHSHHINTPDQKRKFAEFIHPDSGRRVYAGFDWGQRANLEILSGRRQGKSFSVGVVLQAIGPQLFSVDFATRLSRNDLQAKKGVVEELFRRYSVDLAVGDIGDAWDLTHELQKTWGDSFLASRASGGSLINHVKYSNDEFPKVIHFERDYYISELIGLLKQGKIRFPYGSHDRVSWLLDHCCSMEVKVTTDRKGDPVRHYIKGSGPNDGFMALLNAYLAWKFDVTQGFTIKQPQFMKHDAAQTKRGIPAVIGYCPGFGYSL